MLVGRGFWLCGAWEILKLGSGREIKAIRPSRSVPTFCIWFGDGVPIWGRFLFFWGAAISMYYCVE